jgi:arsenate reductase-like glutaredoxin family protein
MELVKPRIKLPKLKVSPLEKEALEAIVQLSESPSNPLHSSPETFSSKKNKDKLVSSQEEIKILKEKNQVLKQKNATLRNQLTTHMGELADECTKLSVITEILFANGYRNPTSSNNYEFTHGPKLPKNHFQKVQNYTTSYKIKVRYDYPGHACTCAI